MSEIDQILKQTLGNASKVIKDYDNGGFLALTPTAAFIKYNTGDCIWFTTIDNGEYQVYRIDTFDGELIDC